MTKETARIVVAVVCIGFILYVLQRPVADAQSTQPDCFHYHQIIVNTLAEAKGIQQRLVNGESFAKLARQYSLDPRAQSTGGDLGDIRPGDLVAVVEAAAEKQPLNVVGIVQSPFGYHVFFVNARWKC